jgi:starch-binding outer membrane protein SusE/F
MKTQKILSLLCVVAIAMVSLTSCKDDSLKPTLKTTVTSNELSNLSAATFVLTLEDAAKNFQTFTWTAPDFGFAAGTSYKLQMDKAEGTFATPVEIASTTILTGSILVGDINKKLLDLGFNPDEAANVKFRVVSTISDKVTPVYSTIQTVKITPYATSFPPIYGMGAALKGWGPWPTNEVELKSTAPSIYEGTAKITNGEAFRFFAQHDWGPTSYNFPFFTTVDSKFVNAGDGDSNLKFVGTTGWFKITVNMKTKAVSAVAVDEPVMFMVGAAIMGWDQAKAVQMTFIKDGVFEGTTAISNETFRFFGQHDWGPTSYNYPFFTTVDNRFENANDGDKNLKFIGTPGSFKVTVDLNAKTVVLQ